MRRYLLLIITVFLSACSTVQTSGISGQVSESLNQERVQLRVRTGNDQMDKIVYEMVYQQFSDILPIKEKSPYTSYLDITFIISMAKQHDVGRASAGRW